jgi:hypothetical protein
MIGMKMVPLDGEGWGNAETGTRSWGRLGPGLTLGSVPAR